MHRSRQWIILTLLGLVGLGPIGSGELLAQTVEGVTIKKGGTVGIDDVFQVDVTVQDFDQSEALEVVVFLVALVQPGAVEGEIDTVHRRKWLYRGRSGQEVSWVDDNGGE